MISISQGKTMMARLSVSQPSLLPPSTTGQPLPEIDNFALEKDSECYS